MVNQDRLIKTFCELVQIDSPSGEEDKIAKELITRLEALGFEVVEDDYGNVIGKMSGEGEVIMLNCHMDTVEPGKGIKPKVEGEIIKSDGSTILAGDAKAGVAAILEALTSIKEDKSKHLPLEIVFTRGEEVALLGATNLNYNLVSAKRGVTFDGEAGVENVTISAPGYNKFDLTITGRAAHAGAEPEKGISAIKIAADIISQLKLGRIDHETTANIGLIEGGSARNAVPEKVHIKGEIRSRDLKKLEVHSKHFQDVLDQVMLKNPEAHFDLLLEREFNPYLFDENNEIIKEVKKALSKIGKKAVLEESGGGTDVNIFHTHGLEAVCVGNGDYEAHTIREYVKIPEMLETAKFCEALVKV